MEREKIKKLISVLKEYRLKFGDMHIDFRGEKLVLKFFDYERFLKCYPESKIEEVFNTYYLIYETENVILQNIIFSHETAIRLIDKGVKFVGS